MNRVWAMTKLVAIATLFGILATAPGGACDVRPDKNLTGGAASIRTKERIAACGHAKGNRGQMTRERQDEVLKRYGFGPGYRGPDGECVGWKALDRICGKPPTTRCKAELVNSDKPPKGKTAPK